MADSGPPRLIEFAPAKVNLALHIVGRRPDGYHTLDSIVAFAEVGDELRFTPLPGGNDLHLSLAGPFAATLAGGPANTVWRAWRAAADHFGVRDIGIAIELVKNLPVASGLGGGTADAAATLRGLIRYWNFSPGRRDLIGLASSLGADVPVSILSTAQRMNGIGETLVPLADWRPLPVVLVNPGVECPTSDVFQAANLPRGKPAFAGLPAGVMNADAAWLQQCRNDLQPAAISRLPMIADVLALLETCPGIELARMSGSGATCFGVFASLPAARKAARLLVRTRPAWWVRSTLLR